MATFTTVHSLFLSCVSLHIFPFLILCHNFTRLRLYGKRNGTKASLPFWPTQEFVFIRDQAKEGGPKALSHYNQKKTNCSPAGWPSWLSIFPHAKGSQVQPLVRGAYRRQPIGVCLTHRCFSLSFSNQRKISFDEDLKKKINYAWADP